MPLLFAHWCTRSIIFVPEALSGPVLMEVEDFGFLEVSKLYWLWAIFLLYWLQWLLIGQT